MTVCKQRLEHSLSGYVRYTSSHYYYYLLLGAFLWEMEISFSSIEPIDIFVV